MKKPWVGFVAVSIFCAGLAFSQSKAQSKPLGNDDIIEMSRAGVPASTIQTMPVNFDLSAQGIVALNSGGVAESVLNQMVRMSTRSKTSATFGVATGTFPIAAAAGKTVRFSGWIKTQNVASGYAGLWWRVDGQETGQILAFDNSESRIIDGSPEGNHGTLRGATGTTDWTRYEIELPVAPQARNINFGVLFTGTGTAWFDALSIELDGVPYVNPQRFDLDFESGPKGFFTHGEGYSIAADNTIAYSGNQSLKMHLVGENAEAKSRAPSGN